jgi:hypothetical protein
MKLTQHRVVGLKALSAVGLAIVTCMTGYAPIVTAHSDSALWGIGGLLTGAMFARAHYQKKETPPTHSTAPAPARAPSAPASMTAEQKIQQLNALAAGGYITPQEYKTEKQAILNSLVE